jgi:Zn-dependent protease with chaperone function
MNLSKHALLSVIITAFCLSGCGLRSASPVPSSVSQTYRDGILSQFPGSAERAPAVLFAADVANEIASRLLHDTPNVQVNVDVIDTQQLLAFSYPGGIVLSTGVIRRLPDETMCAFVLAHELSHHILGHLDLKDNEELSVDELFAREMAADRRAVALMASAAYDLRAAPIALELVGPAIHGQSTQLELRRRTLSEMITESKWAPPGTISRRVYKEMLARLRG